MNKHIFWDYKRAVIVPIDHGLGALSKDSKSLAAHCVRSSQDNPMP